MADKSNNPRKIGCQMTVSAVNYVGLGERRGNT